MRVGNCILGFGVLRLPLVRTGGALCQLPVVVVEVLVEPVVPLCRLVRPGALEPTGNRVATLAAAVAVLPAEALLLKGGTLRFGAHIVGSGGRAMGLAEGVTASNERDRLLVVHRHSTKGLTDVASSGQRIGITVWPLRIHVDEAHLHCAKRLGQLAIAPVALVSEPRLLRAP